MAKGHTDAIQSLHFSPDLSLIVSASLDKSVKVWGVDKTRRHCLGQYWGHTKGAKEAVFTAGAAQVLTAGYDHKANVWNTETGQLVQSIEVPALPQCLAHYPGSESFMVGCENSKIYQYDLRSGEMNLIYERHLSAVNSITFIDQGRRFVSSSSDKTLRYWESGTPVEIKILQEDWMFSCPKAAFCPANGFIAYQSMDNQVLLYGGTQENGYKLNRKKRYVGHLVAGYACGLDWSSDGSFLYSGDSNGTLFVWDQKTSRLIRRIKASQGVINDVLVHPIDPCLVFSGDSKGKINVYE
jgi:pre-mRNA-processing factor 17